uniref:Uncharacterized protein n=1 Tax=Tanacetum cinerariifolium TaxID=118510 RepID=A0A6L2JA14_TANCI|nr:hypothetical protein [Tanacetum cinerariifolium]
MEGNYMIVYRTSMMKHQELFAREAFRIPINIVVKLLQIVSIWVPLPKDVVGASTQRCGGSLYPKMLWEPLPKDVVGASWQIEGEIRSDDQVYLKWWPRCLEWWLRVVMKVVGLLLGGDNIPFVLSWGGSISPDSFLSPILLLVVMVVIVVVTVIVVVVVVAIIGVVIVVTIIGVVVVDIVGGVPSIIKLLFVIVVTVPSMLWGNPPDENFHNSLKPMDETNSSFRTIEVERISFGMKKLNIDDNTGDGGKVVGETIGTCGGIRVGLTHSQIKKKYFPVKLGNSPERPGDNLGKLEEKPSSTSDMLWEPLPKDVVGASTQDMVGASWQMEVLGVVSKGGDGGIRGG